MDKTAKVDLVKTVVGISVGIGIQLIVSGIVKNNVVATRPIQKPFIWAGTQGVSSLVGEVTRRHTDDQIDAVVNWWEKAQENYAKEEEATEE